MIIANVDVSVTGMVTVRFNPRLAEIATGIASAVRRASDAARRLLGPDSRLARVIDRFLEAKNFVTLWRACRDARVAPRPARRPEPGGNPGIPLPRFARLRLSAPRQSVPPRTRRRARTWER